MFHPVSISSRENENMSHLGKDVLKKQDWAAITKGWNWITPRSKGINHRK